MSKQSRFCVGIFSLVGWQKLTLCLLLVVLLNMAACSNVTNSPPAVAQPYQDEILWDSWGVPHIYGKDDAGLFYGFGWAQMESHADLLLRLYGVARGRAAEYWGQSYLSSDQNVRRMAIPDHAQQWYDEQNPAFRQDIAAFVAGINDYANQHAAAIEADERVVLPVQPADVMAHLENTFYAFLSPDCHIPGMQQQGAAGSNGWAVAPSHAEPSTTMLLANPHLSWSGAQIFYEAQLTSPGFEAYGAALVGLPVLLIAFNQYLSWTHTVNTLQGCTTYKLTLQGAGYLFDGQVKAFSTQTEIIKVKQKNGTISSQPFVIRRSVQGPVVQNKGNTLAVRMVALDQFSAAGALQEWWDMARAQNLSEFQNVLQRLQIPLFMVIYADRDGNIMSLFNGQVPQHTQGDWNYWSGLVPGDTSKTLWQTILPYKDLPQVVNPPSGWVQNSNSPPWTTTFPLQLDPAHYPAYLAPQSMGLREQEGVTMLMQTQHLSFEQLIQDKFSAHVELADRVLPDLLKAVQQYGDADAKSAANVLQVWDRTADANSRGDVLFYEWLQKMQMSNPPGQSFFAVPWSAKNPLSTPSGLANPHLAASVLSQAAKEVQAQYGALNVRWGDVFRIHIGTADYPASGGDSGMSGIFRALAFAPIAGDSKHYQALGGDTYIAAVTFTPTGVQARVLLTYGNADQPGSIHHSDQLALYAQNQLRTAWLTRADVQAHLGTHETF